jgi:hypothetical protein
MSDGERMFVLTEDARLICKHINGVVGIVPTQTLVTVEGRRLLVEDNPEQRPIAGCPNIGPTIKPCTTTLRVQKGYSEWIRIEDNPLCLDAVTGLTDGTPPCTVDYIVQRPGQEWVAQEGE